MPRGFHTIDYAGLSPEGRAEGSILLGGSAAEFHDGDPESPEQVLDEIGLTAERRGGLIVAVLRWGDPHGPEILTALDERTGVEDEARFIPYNVTLALDRFLATFNEAPGLSLDKILETEGELLEDREREALAELAETEFESTLDRLQAYAAMPMRALILPWNEEVASELMLRNNAGMLGSLESGQPSERRFYFCIIGDRVFNEGISMHLDTQPDRIRRED